MYERARGYVPWLRLSLFVFLFRLAPQPCSRVTWIYPVLFGILALFAVVKEWIVRDKRISAMLSFLVMMLGHRAADTFTALYQQPLLEILRRIQ